MARHGPPNSADDGQSRAATPGVSSPPAATRVSAQKERHEAPRGHPHEARPRHAGPRPPGLGPRGRDHGRSARLGIAPGPVPGGRPPASAALPLPAAPDAWRSGQRRDKPAQWCRVHVPDSAGPATHTGPESGGWIGHGQHAALTGACPGSVGRPATALVAGADALRPAAGPTRRRREGEAETAPAGSETSAWTDTRGAAPGRPGRGPGAGAPGPHGAPEGHDRGARVQGVGPRQRTAEACAQRSPQGTGGRRGRAGSGPRGTWQRQPGAGHRAGVSCRRHAAAYGRHLAGACTSTRDRSPVRSCRTPGSVRGVLG